MQTITILIPTKNEEKFILHCLNSVFEFETPEHTTLNIVVVDGMSEDNTPQIVRQFIAQGKNVTLLQNKAVFQGPGLNLAITKTKGKFICRLDAHSIYPKDYVKRLFELSNKTNADNVGGAIQTHDSSDTLGSAIVMSVTTHWFGVGNSTFRISEKIGEVDTVPFGFFNRNIFEKIGLFDERLTRCQDYEFNSRIRASGGKIFINTGIKIKYFNQQSFFQFLRKQISLEGPYNAYMWRVAPYSFNLRHCVTAIFTSGLVIGPIVSTFSNWLFYSYISCIFTYIVLAMVASLQSAKRYNKYWILPFLPPAFLAFHVCHGFGVLMGLFTLLTNQSPVKSGTTPYQGADHFQSWDKNKNKRLAL